MNTQRFFITAMISIVTFSTACQSNGTSENTAKEKAPALGLMSTYDSTDSCLTTSIPVDSANKMINSYLTSIGGSTPTNENLYSLIMDANSLRCYLSNPEIKNVKLMFAHTLDYINKGHGGQNAGYGSGKLTLVIAGYDQNGNYVLDAKAGVEDNMRPCPHDCPTVGTAASNTISH
jgi:hypothetical protein